MACSIAMRGFARATSSISIKSASIAYAFSTAAAGAVPQKIVLTGITEPKKPLRVVDPFRLRKRGKWSDVVPYMATLKVSFDPAADGTMGCKELWRQSRSQAMRKLYPKFVVELDINEKAAPAELVVTYNNGKVQKIAASGKSVFDIYDEMMEFTAEMEEKEEMVEMDKN